MVFTRSTGMPFIDARDDFSRARRRHLVAWASSWIIPGRRWGGFPATLDEATLPQGAARLEVISLKDIVGTVEPTTTFDARFRPASEIVRRRWERIALAHRTGVALPPITVRRGSDGYYVNDGRHRVSVALALGHRDIDAWVTGTESLSSPALACAV